MTTKSYGIEEISSWLLQKGSEIELPAIQRGFVWRTYQIENLWDSIFRGYPVGSFLLSEKETHKELFDGQQRATSIALGFYNPWEQHSEKKFIGNDKSLPTIWLDLAPAEEPCSDGTQVKVMPENSAFLFRVLTKSHPWGYRAWNNSEKMSLKDRTDAWNQMKEYGADKYTKLTPSQRLPYSARIPVPLCFLFDSYKETFGKDDADFREAILDRCLYRHYFPESFQPYYIGREEKTYEQGLKEIPSESWSIWREKIAEVLDKKTYSIPAVILPSKVMELKNDSSSLEDPTLFVRLNSGGTALQGEDLIYSIFKSYYPLGKDLVESVSIQTKNLISPSRIIVLAARLVLAEIAGGKYQKSITSAAFQSYIKNRDFKEGMDRMVEGRMAKLIGESIEILRMRLEDGSQRVPDIVVKSFVKDCPEGMMLLLNFLKQELELTPGLHMAICRKLYRNYWFGLLDAIAKDGRNWEASVTPEFWMATALPSGWGYNQLPLIEPDVLEAFLLRRVVPFEASIHRIEKGQEDSVQVWDFFKRFIPEENEGDIPALWDNFLWRLHSSNTNRNKAFILLAQGDYIQKEFEEYNQLEDLQDTNTPWDWDHIFPKSWTRGESNLESDWVNRIGNFRAMPLVVNRKENDECSPKERFSPEFYKLSSESDDAFKTILKNYFIDPAHDYQDWLKLDTRLRYCPKEGKEEFERNFAGAIIKRGVNIYRHFYNLFGIHDGSEQ
jgi:hypothetical protein